MHVQHILNWTLDTVTGHWMTNVGKHDVVTEEEEEEEQVEELKLVYFWSKL